MKKSAVFFDIDGTLWDYYHTIPESTIQGVRQLRANGHYAFICSGRSRATIRAKELLDIGFDGIVAGCGTYVEYHSEVLLNVLLPWQQIVDTIPIFKERGIGAFYEGCDKLYIDWDFFDGEAYAMSFVDELGADCLGADALTPASQINKLSIDYRDSDTQTVLDCLSENYQVVVHDLDKVAELMPKGYSKATGIQWICDYLEIAPERTYAFGDSANDVDMLQYVKHGIAMGDGSSTAKAAADYVTKPMLDGGIYHGLKQFGLIS